METEVVYVIGAPDSSLVKIGRSAQAKKRLAGIQRMSPIALGILCEFDGGHRLETALHREFKHLRTHGEWFDFGGKNPVVEIADAVGEIRTRWANASVERTAPTGRWDYAPRSPAGRAAAALAALEAIPNAVERWKAAGEMTESVRLATPRVAQVRQQVVRELRGQGMTYRAVGDLLGIHFTRVKQLESGEPATKWKQSAAEPTDVEGAAETAG